MNSHGLFCSHFASLASRLAVQGADVTLIAPDVREADLQRLPQVRFWPIAMSRSAINPFGELRVALALARSYRRFGLQLVHHVTAKAVIPGSLAAATVPGLAVVNTISGLGYAFARPGHRRLVRSAISGVYRLALNGVDGSLIFENSDDREEFRRLGVRAADSADVIPGTGVDCDRFRPQLEPLGVPVMAFVGRLIADKGIHEFLAAAKIIQGRRVEVRLALIGDFDRANPSGLCRDELLSACRASGVEYWGYRSDMVAAYSQVNGVVLPSWREGFPRVLQEAAACGLPVITTDVAGCRDAVIPGVSGLLVPPGNPEVLASCIVRIASDSDLRARMGAAGRLNALAYFQDEQIHARIFDCYRRALVQTGQVSEGG